MRVVRQVIQILGVGITALLLSAGSCSGSDSNAQSIPASSTDTTTDPTSGAPDNDTDENSSADAEGGVATFQTVFGVPPFGTATVDPAFGQYMLVDDDFQTRESVFFELANADLDQTVAYFTEMLMNAGYQVNEFPLGSSMALNLSTGDPAVTGVVQIGPLSPTDPTLGINQELSRLKIGDATDDGSEAEGGSSGSADDAADASDG